MYKVVLVDDEPIIVEGLARSVPWQQWDCEVVATANDGLEGKAMIETYAPDIIFMDICMPELDGLSMIAAIKSQYPDMQICILTGFRDFEYARDAIRLGVTRFLLKPSNMEEIEEAIQTMCENRKKKKSDGRETLQKEKNGEDTEGENSPGSFIVKNALTYIRENYQKRLTLSEVAEKTYVSQWHLSKLLNGHTGQSFSEILNHVRIEEAKKLL